MRTLFLWLFLRFCFSVVLPAKSPFALPAWRRPVARGRPTRPTVPVGRARHARPGPTGGCEGWGGGVSRKPRGPCSRAPVADEVRTEVAPHRRHPQMHCTAPRLHHPMHGGAHGQRVQRRSCRAAPRPWLRFRQILGVRLADRGQLVCVQEPFTLRTPTPPPLPAGAYSNGPVAPRGIALRTHATPLCSARPVRRCNQPTRPATLGGGARGVRASAPPPVGTPVLPATLLGRLGGGGARDTCFFPPQWRSSQPTRAGGPGTTAVDGAHMTLVAGGRGGLPPLPPPLLPPARLSCPPQAVFLPWCWRTHRLLHAACVLAPALPPSPPPPFVTSWASI